MWNWETSPSLSYPMTCPLKNCTDIDVHQTEVALRCGCWLALEERYNTPQNLLYCIPLRNLCLAAGEFRIIPELLTFEMVHPAPPTHGKKFRKITHSYTSLAVYSKKIQQETVKYTEIWNKNNVYRLWLSYVVFVSGHKYTEYIAQATTVTRRITVRRKHNHSLWPYNCTRTAYWTLGKPVKRSNLCTLHCTADIGTLLNVTFIYLNCMTCIAAYRLLTRCFNRMPPRQIQMNIVMSLANIYTAPKSCQRGSHNYVIKLSKAYKASSNVLKRNC